MVRAAWFGFDQPAEKDRDRLSRPHDPLVDLVGIASLTDRTYYVPRSIARPDPVAQFSIGVSTRPTDEAGSGSASTPRLEAARDLARDMIVRTLDRVSHSSIDASDWLDDSPLLDELAAAIAAREFTFLRAGFVPSGANQEAGGQNATLAVSASPNDAGVSTATPSPATSDAASAASGRFAPPIMTLMSEGDNNPPVAYSHYVEVTHDCQASDGVYFYDPDWDDTPWVVLDSGVSHGSLNFGSDGYFTYTPDSQYVGSDSFTFHATDGMDDSDSATVTIQVSNQAPVVYSHYVEVTHDCQASDGVYFYDDDWVDTPWVVLDSGVSHGSLNFSSDGYFTYTPDSQYVGSDSFTYHATDGIDDSDSATVTIAVSNQEPVAYSHSVQLTHDSQTTDAVYFYDDDWIDTPWAVLDTDVSHGSLSFGSDGYFTYTPAPQYVGSDSFTYHATDGIDDSDSATVTIEVLNQEPVAYEHSTSVTHDTQLYDHVYFYDDDWSDTPWAVLDSSVSNGTLDFQSDGSFTYIPSYHYVGPDSFTYHATDGIDDSTVALVSIQVTNAPPEALDDGPYAVVHSTPTRQTELSLGSPGVMANDSDLDWDELTVTLETAPQHAGPGAFQLNQDGSFDYTPEIGYVGPDSFTYRASDGIASDTATVSIDVTNNPPITQGEAYTAIVNTQLVIPSPRWPGVVGVRDNDSDPDGDEITVSWHDQPQHGTISVAADGSFTYTPQADYEGNDSFHYRVSDGFDQSEQQVVNINVFRPLVDLDTDSDNTGVVDHSQLEDDDEMAAPGKILRYNADDDNANDVEDRLESPLTNPAGPVDDDDLFPVELAVGIMTPQMDGFTLEITHDATLTLWEDQSKSTAATLNYTIGTDTIPSLLFMEGFDTGQGQVQCILRNDAGVQVNADVVLATVVDVRLRGYTPQTVPFVPLVIADTRDDEHAVRIRRNGDDDDDSAAPDWQETNVTAEDDLIQVDVHADPTFPPQVGYTLERSGDAVRVWSTSSKANCYLDSAGPVPIAGGDYTMWVEYNPARNNTESVVFGVRDQLHNRKAFDVSLQFTPFNSTIVVFGGRNQAPADPPSQDHGAFALAKQLYEMNYDVHPFHEDTVDDAAQLPHNEVISAVDERGVTQVAIMGYSYGSGATYLLANDLAATGPNAPWNLAFTAYIDAIVHDSWGGPVTALPSSTAYHVNYWQSYTGDWYDLNGVPIAGANFNLDVRTTAWGALLTHYTIDDHANVIGRIINGSTATGSEGPHDGVTTRVAP